MWNIKCRIQYNRNCRPSTHSGWSRASIACVLRKTSNQDPEVLMIKRTSRVGDPWSGHVAFPGGRRNPADRSDLETCIRETKEEVDLNLLDSSAFRHVARLGEFEVRPLGSSGVVVACHVFESLKNTEGNRTHDALPESFEFNVQASEVESAFWVPLSWVSRKDLHSYFEWTAPAAVGNVLGKYLRVLGLDKIRLPALMIEHYGTRKIDRLKLDTQKLGTQKSAKPVVVWGMSLSILEIMAGKEVPMINAVNEERALLVYPNSIFFSLLDPWMAKVQLFLSSKNSPRARSTIRAFNRYRFYVRASLVVNTIILSACFYRLVNPGAVNMARL